MGLGASSRSRGPIGVDLGTQHVRLLQLAGGDRPRVVAAAQRALPTDKPLTGEAYHEAVGEALKAMLDRGGFRGRGVISALPAHVMHFKNLRLPKMPPQELAQAVEWEAAERLQLGDTNVEVRYFDAGEVRQGDEVREEVILMAAPTAFTEAHVNTLQRCGLKPIAFDVAPAALARCVGDASDASNLDAPGHVVVDVGYTSSKVLIVRRGRVLFFKLIDVGGQKLDDMVAEQLGLSRAEAAETRHRQLDAQANEDNGGHEALFGAGRGEEVQRAMYEAMRPAMADLAREVSLCLRYYSVTFRGERPGHIALTGGEAHQPALSALLAEGTGVEVSALDPLADVALGSWGSVVDAGAGRAAWTVAAGMARRRETSATKRRAA